jgi:hypothetical protein
MPELWQSVTVDFLAGNILLYCCVRALLARVLSIQKGSSHSASGEPSRTASSSKGRGNYFRQPDSGPGNGNLDRPAIILARLL